MKRKISKVLMTLFFFVLIANICSAQNTARGIAAEKTLGLKSLDEPEIWVENILGINCVPVAFTSDFSCVVLKSCIDSKIFYIANFQTGEYFCIGKKTAKISKDEKYLCIFYSNEDCVVYDLKSKEKTDTTIDDFLEIEDVSYDDERDIEKQSGIEDYPDWYSIKEKESSKVYLGVGEEKLYGVDLTNKKQLVFNTNYFSNYRQTYIYNNKKDREICRSADSIIVTTKNNELTRFNLKGRQLNVYKNSSECYIEYFYQDNNYLIVFYTNQLCIYDIFSNELIESFILPDDFPFFPEHNFYVDLSKKVIFVYRRSFIVCKYSFDVEKQIWNYGDIYLSDIDGDDRLLLCYKGNYQDNRYENILFYSAYDDLNKQEKIIAFNLDNMDIEFEFRLNFDLDETLKKCFKGNSIGEYYGVIIFNELDNSIFFLLAYKDEDKDSYYIAYIEKCFSDGRDSIVINLEKKNYKFVIEDSIFLFTENGDFEIYNIENLEKIYSYKGNGKYVNYTVLKNKIHCFEDEKLKIISASGKLEKVISSYEEYFNSEYFQEFIFISAQGCSVRNPFKYDVAYSPDNFYFFSELYHFNFFSNGDYLTYTPEGFFTGTEWAMKNLVHIVDGMDVIGIDQVYDKLYRPDLVAAKMRGEDISEYAKEVNLASIVRSGNAPAVAIENLPELSDSRDVTFDICVQNTGGGIGNVSIVLNGKTIQLSEGVASSKGEQKIFRHTVTLQNGQNKIEAFAMNSAGMIESRRASADVNWQGKTSKPNLYVLTVAVNKYRDKDLWLNYCVPDAASIEESFKKQQNGLYQNVCVYSLKDAEVTKEGLEQKFKELSSIVTADDVFVFFVSGHGTTYDDGDYYFIPVNFRYTNKTDIPLKAISKSDLTKNLSLIKAGKTLMMLDTCNSGSFFADSNKRGMGDKGIFERLSRATGHAILAAASDSQSAMEGYNGHGVFTYVLLDGLAGNADSDGDGFVTLTELSSYVENQVPELSYEKWGYEQVPQKELRRQDFPIAETVLK